MMTLNDAMNAIKDRKEFRAIKVDGRVIISYAISVRDTFDGLRRQFRGIVFDEETGELISLPFHKFHNVNENEETLFAKISHLKATIYEKLDGSLVHFYKHRGRILASTKRSIDTPQAIAAYQLAKDRGILNTIERLIDQGWTPLFEFVSPKNPIVVRYDRNRLVYLMSRRRKTGEYVHMKNLFEDVATRYEIPFHDIFNHISKEDFEGYVCYLENGQIVKVKTPWYAKLHRHFDIIQMATWKLYEIALEDKMDDFIPLVNELYRPALRDILYEVQSDLIEEIFAVEQKYEEICRKFNSIDPLEKNNRAFRKAFALEAQKHHELTGLIMTLFDDQSIETGIKKRLEKRYHEMHKGKFIDSIIKDCQDDRCLTIP